MVGHGCLTCRLHRSCDIFRAVIPKVFLLFSAQISPQILKKTPHSLAARVGNNTYKSAKNMIRIHIACKGLIYNTKRNNTIGIFHGIYLQVHIIHHYNLWYPHILYFIWRLGTCRWNMATWSSWWSHQMETFSMLLALCAGNSSVTG